MRIQFTDEQRAEIYRLQIECGLTREKIAEQYCCSVRAIGKQLWLHRESLKKRGKLVTYMRDKATQKKQPRQPSYSAVRSVDVEHLRVGASTNIGIRIAEQGLTAGIFGDPPRGRSALDQMGAVS